MYEVIQLDGRLVVGKFETKEWADCYANRRPGKHLVVEVYEVEESVEITLTLTELEWLLDLTDETAKKNELWKLKTHPITRVDSKLHVALEGTDHWKGL